jgi:hypothetical protein
LIDMGPLPNGRGSLKNRIVLSRDRKGAAKEWLISEKLMRKLDARRGDSLEIVETKSQLDCSSQPIPPWELLASHAVKLST